MTSRSHKKHRITARTFSRATCYRTRSCGPRYGVTVRATALVALCFGVTLVGEFDGAAWAQQNDSSDSYRPVTVFNQASESAINTDSARAIGAQSAPSSQAPLRWLRPNISPEPHHIPTSDVFFDDDRVKQGLPPQEVRRSAPNPMRDVRTADYYRDQEESRLQQHVPPNQNTPSNIASSGPASPVQQASWQQDAAESNATRVVQYEDARDAKRDFFSNPFGERGRPVSAKRQSMPRNQVRTGNLLPRTQLRPPSQTQPVNSSPVNRLAQQSDVEDLFGGGRNTAAAPQANAATKGLGLPNNLRSGPDATAPRASQATAPNAANPSSGSMQLPFNPEEIPPPSPQTPAPQMPSPAPGETFSELPAPAQPSGDGNLFDALNSTPETQPGDSLRPLLQDAPDLGPPSPSESDIDPRSEPNLSEANADSPSDRKELFENPFAERETDRAADADDLERLQQRMKRDKIEDPDLGLLEGNGGNESRAPEGLTCEEFRSRIQRETLRTLSLDISPPFRPDLFDEKEFLEIKSKFDRNQVSRPWTTMDGAQIASGRLVDLAYEKVVIENELGARQELQMQSLSEGDLAYISKNWGLPKECRLPQIDYVPRNWQRSVVTWKASNLCHKPLYFEEVNLERYGHTAGPILQPIVSSAHFFANIAVMPYKMGIHPPNECQYALGYYRPGNCAPWIVPPIPISGRGAAAQIAAVTTGFWLIP